MKLSVHTRTVAIYAAKRRFQRVRFSRAEPHPSIKSTTKMFLRPSFILDGAKDQLQRRFPFILVIHYNIVHRRRPIRDDFQEDDGDSPAYLV